MRDARLTWSTYWPPTSISLESLRGLELRFKAATSTARDATRGGRGRPISGIEPVTRFSQQLNRYTTRSTFETSSTISLIPYVGRAT